jgi:REP element-mobilizing transposase RayT
MSAGRRHEQILLFRNGGKRRGAGRKPIGARAGTPHGARPFVDGSQALHVTLRVAPEVGCMRREVMYRAVRAATVVAAQRGRIRIVQLSIQGNHLHMLIEVEAKEALSRGLQGFQISVARNVNSVLRSADRRRKGRVFADRYHLVMIESPRQARNVLAYVLNNWRRHGEDRRGAARAWLLDRFSSACSFAGWKELGGRAPEWTLPEGYEALRVSAPRSWLLSTGWKLAGPIGMREVPGPQGRNS